MSSTNLIISTFVFVLPVGDTVVGWLAAGAGAGAGGQDQGVQITYVIFKYFCIFMYTYMLLSLACQRYVN